MESISQSLDIYMDYGENLSVVDVFVFSRFDLIYFLNIWVGIVGECVSAMYIYIYLRGD